MEVIAFDVQFVQLDLFCHAAWPLESSALDTKGYEIFLAFHMDFLNISNLSLN